jgi:hypothetical protein
MIVNGSTMMVTQNLYDVLVHICFSVRDRIVWADAIFISQCNYKEREH